ncbi:small toxic polypeptide LdrA/B/C/D [Microbacterium natoriense]|uniref:Small toxic polypeptide LdrA/B/C/D n=1 Tax=Microbacterium natoriense TaxID=284570 RepID=A0AAW8ESU8_9MICO|nr:lycopene cyclase domain-containing protein [Microbacterium natoriense]MDQ0646197.1 small toxic polypeptide LdrA/B/C/D [Microbacterium natoriense]
MTYLLLAGVFLVLAVVLAAVFGRGVRRVSAGPLALGALVLLILTAVFDTVMIAAGLFTYADPLILGPRIGLAPIEDFAYPLAAVILLPALWTRLRSRDDR